MHHEKPQQERAIPQEAVRRSPEGSGEDLRGDVAQAKRHAPGNTQAGVRQVALEDGQLRGRSSGVVLGDARPELRTID